MFKRNFIWSIVKKFFCHSVMCVMNENKKNEKLVFISRPGRAFVMRYIVNLIDKFYCLSAKMWAAGLSDQGDIVPKIFPSAFLFLPFLFCRMFGVFSFRLKVSELIWSIPFLSDFLRVELGEVPEQEGAAPD